MHHTKQRSETSAWAADCDPCPTPGFAAVVALAAIVAFVFCAGACTALLVTAA